MMTKKHNKVLVRKRVYMGGAITRSWGRKN